VQYLTNFGETGALSEQDIELAEKFLVRCWVGVRSTTAVDTFDQLRLEVYTSAVCGIDQLPPTSSVIRGHISRAAYLINKACNLLVTAHEQEEPLEATDHGWEEKFGTLLPSKYLKPLPSSTVCICKCSGKCDTRRCGCRVAKVKCAMFCHGKNDKTSCKN